MNEIERRHIHTELRSKGDSATIEGYAAVYNSPSEDLGFLEIILPGAFDRAIREGHDVRALWNHNTDIVLGRTKSGSLRLSTDDHGLKIENDMPDTQAGRDAMVLIKRGDVSEMSFAFRTLEDNWRTENGEQVRELLDVELLDVSPVAFPAYSATHVSARAIEHLKASGCIEVIIAGTEHVIPPEKVAAAVAAAVAEVRCIPNGINRNRLRMSR